MTEKPLSDLEIINKCINGDKEIFRELISRYKALVYSVITGMVSNREDYDDLAQEIFIKAYKGLNKYSSQYRFSTWIIRIATNHIIDYRRKNKIECVPLEQAEYSLSSCSSPEEELLKRENHAVIEKIINQLPEMYRLPLTLYHQQGMSYDMISEALDLPLSKVKNRIYRGRKQSRENYEQYLKKNGAD